MQSKDSNAISLFCSGGIGDLALRAVGFEILVSNELSKERHDLHKVNFPETLAITGNIWEEQDRIITETRRLLGGAPLDLLYATPPCQGMSKNGRGKLLNAIRAGLKPPLDPRNRLIIPTMAIASALRPRLVLLENVPEMEDTIIVDERGEAFLIVDYVRKCLGPEYEGRAEVVEFADYGVPQRRQRLISIFSRDAILRGRFRAMRTLLPPATHSMGGSDSTQPWVTVRDAIGHLPPLDAKSQEGARSEIPFHRVPLLDERKYWWVSSTPAGASAFDNQCPACGHAETLEHSASRGQDGINRTSRETPVRCEKCGAALPRPTVDAPDGSRRLMRGFTSAYKRMSFDQPSPALTRNLSYACSDNKLHPVQHRVLSLQEAFILHTVDQYEYRWTSIDGKPVSDKVIREVIGESIPPLGLHAILAHLLRVSMADGQTTEWGALGPLFEHIGTTATGSRHCDCVHSGSRSVSRS